MAFLKELQLTLFRIVPWMALDRSKMASNTLPLNSNPMFVKI